MNGEDGEVRGTEAISALTGPPSRSAAGACDSRGGEERAGALQGGQGQLNPCIQVVTWRLRSQPQRELARESRQRRETGT